MAGMVFDEDYNDVIIIGEIVYGEPLVTIDDLVVAMHARLKDNLWPKVSIDKTADTSRTGKQLVRFEGSLNDTGFGKDLLAADVILKRLALGQLPTSVWGFQSYFTRTEQYVQENSDEESISSRFWFEPRNIHLAKRENVFAISELHIGVSVQVLGATSHGKAVDDLNQVIDLSGEEFASDLTAHYDELRTLYPEIARLKQLFDLVGLAEGMRILNLGSNLSFWLDEYKLARVDTDKTVSLLYQKSIVLLSGKERTLEINGGIEVKALVSSLKDGDVTALRDAVLKSKPNKNSLVWEVPLEGWNLPGYPYNPLGDIESQKKDVPHYPQAAIGCSMTRQLNNTQNRTFDSITIGTQRSSAFPSNTTSRVNISNQLVRTTPSVGGVMLENVAKVRGDQSGPLDMAGAKFSFVVDGNNSQLDPQTFRKFVTALWAVYYSNEDPGISIDPIAPGAKKHLVRYIGQVINTDLGRVMREGDYLMKKWAVGTDKAEIDGFKSPLDYAADTGSLAVGTWSRFWFVPKDMQFRRCGDMLLFEGGRMTVQTEYMFRGFGSGADPSNQRFAEFFTERYQDIAQKYPVYQELYEYAKMVSLAKYLKESGVPLFWFLMANKDLVITEDSVSTVDALVKDSKQFEGVQVEGGVDLHSEGQYIYDNEALSAVNSALAKLPSRPSGTTLGGVVPNKTVSEPFSFALKERSFSVLPQHSSSSGKDYRGIRYQTDFSLKEAGFQLTDRSMAELNQAIFRLKYTELLYAAAKDEPSGDKVETIIEESWQKAQAVSEEITGNLKVILHKDFKSKARLQDELAKYMPAEELLKWKDLIAQYASYNTNLELVRWFSSGRQQNGLFGPGWDLLVPYQIKALGKDVVEYESLALPRRITLIDKLSGREEVLTFDKDRFMAVAYVPDNIKSSRVVGLFVMTDGSFRLLDKIENEFAFNSAGYLKDMIFSDTHQIHFEYQKDFAVKSETAPYKIEKADSNWIEFRDIKVPEKLLVKNLANGSGEALVFSKGKTIVGYVPESVEGSHFKFLALMSDLSYRLVDQKGNEIVFNQSGEFEKLISTSEEYLIKSMSSGNYAVDFSYKINEAGKPVISQAELTKDGRSDSKITMQYFYGTDDRLGKVAVKEKRDIKATAKYVNFSPVHSERLPVLDEN